MPVTNSMVGDNFGEDLGFVEQISDFSLGPHQTKPWEYAIGDNTGWKEDATLKVIAWQK